MPDELRTAGADLAARFSIPKTPAPRLAPDAAFVPAPAEKLAILNEIGQVLCSTLSLDELYETIYQQVRRVLAVDAFFIGLWDPARNEIDYSIGMADGRRVPPKVLPLREGMTAHVIHTHKPVFIRDYRRERSGYPQQTTWLKRQVPASLLLVPMLHRDQVVGVISVRSYRPYAYDDDDVQLLSTIAAQAAIAIQNARLYAQQERRLSELMAQHEVGRQMTASTPDLRKLLQLVVSEAAKLADADGSRLEVRAAYGLPEEMLADEDMRLGIDVAERCMTQGRPALLRAGEPGLAATGPHAQCLIAAPLAIGERVLGVLLLSDSRSAHAFDEEHLESTIRLAGQAAVAIQTAALFDQLQEATVGIMQALGEAIESRDHYTSGHVEEVSTYAVELAAAMGLGHADVETVRRGALLHDIGKIAVGETLLQKRGPLSEQEAEEMRQHPAIGAAIVQHVKSLSSVVPVVLYHQEKFDGSGYPQGLKGKEIPLGARIIAVTDAYHAMTSHRPYRQSLGHAHAVAELRRCAGTHFDPEVVEAFLQVLDRQADGANGAVPSFNDGENPLEDRAAS